MRPSRQNGRAPAGQRGCDADSGDRVAEVVLAIAECPLAVLPRFAPVDGRQRDEQDVTSARVRRHPRVRVERASLLEHVPVRSVVIDGGRIGKAAYGSADHIRFGRMKVAARRIGAQGPARFAVPLPRRETQRVPQHIANGRRAQRLGRGRRTEQLVVRDDMRHVAVIGVRGSWIERVLGRVRVRAEWTRLRRPVEVPE